MTPTGTPQQSRPTTAQLKNVMVAEHLSEETTAYTATLYIDGVAVATCENHGQGGSDDYGPVRDKTGYRHDRFKAAVEAFGGRSKMEDAVQDLLTEWMENNDAKRFKARATKKGFPFTVRTRVLDYVIEGFTAHDGTVIQPYEVTAMHYNAFRTEADAKRYMELEVPAKYKDNLRSVEVY